MFDFLFGWRKASKCKRLMRQVQCRLMLLKNKRCSIVRQLRHDVVELLKLGHGQIAFTRAEQIYKDERIIEVYDLLEHFCEFLVINLAYIRRHKDCPNDINEAMSSLIFASARCGDIPELRKIRRLFGERYGQRLVMTALELLPNNLVNPQIRNNLSIKSVAEDVKIRLVNEIFRDSHLHGHPESSPLALEYNSEWHQKQAKEEANQQSSVKDDELLCITLPGAMATMSAPADQHCSPIKALLPATQGPGKEDKFRILSTLSHTSDELVQCLEENMVYLDDIQEFQSPKSKDINLLDQRVFVFKSFLLTNKQKMDAVEKSRKTIGKVSNRRSRKRSLWSFEDISYESYYGNKSPWIVSNDMCKSTQRRKELKKNNLEHSQEALNNERASSFDENNAETRLSTNCPKQGTIIPLGDEPSLSSNQSSYEVIDESETKESDFYSCSDCPSWRSISMPNERQETEHQRCFLRYSSLPVQRSSNENHIHPKLPDYKELELTFLALKNAYLLNNNH
ncbi:hypothetical protein QQ045_020278 [Rhodiola kirilowii]